MMLNLEYQRIVALLLLPISVAAILYFVIVRNMEWLPLMVVAGVSYAAGYFFRAIDELNRKKREGK